jgi:hypothetical protein
MNKIEQLKKEAVAGLFLSLTGGGTEAISDIIKGGGASHFFLGARVPYNEQELMDICGPVTKTVSDKIALLLSNIGGPSYNTMVASEKPIVSIGCTASLARATNQKEREGREHKAYINVSLSESVHFKQKYITLINFKKKRTRLEEERILADVIIELAYAFCCSKKVPDCFPGLDKDEVINLNEVNNNTCSD